MKSVDKKTQQLGMNPSTASGRLVKDLLFNFVVQTGNDSCYRCGEKIDRESFSIEHKEVWLDSEDPLGLFFDKDNIAYSHLRCNSLASRGNTNGRPCGTQSKYKAGCRCEACVAGNAAYKRSMYTTEKRQLQYRRSGN